MTQTAGELLRLALEEKPLQMIGVSNPYLAIMAQECGFRAFYLSGAGVANFSFGLPDLDMMTLDNILDQANRITNAVKTPLLVDVDTGWGGGLLLERAIQQLCRIGVAGVHLEDQTWPKRCGHRHGKKVVPIPVMIERLKRALDARQDRSFVVMARTDAYEAEGISGVIQRGVAYREAGADMFFPEALTSLEEYRQVKIAVDCPVLANLTEFGQTPTFSKNELARSGIDIVLYPLSINRVMNEAAYHALQTIRKQGTQRSLIPSMETREKLYERLNYIFWENRSRDAHTHQEK